MTPPESHPVDRLVREHLDAEARTVDGESMLRRVRPASPTSRTTHERRHRLGWFASGMAIAASIALAIAIGLPAPKIVTAAELLNDAQSVHTRGQDRCYLLTIEIETGAIRMLDLPPIVRTSKVWTRGDQFYLETTPPNPNQMPLVWGQDATGRVWVAMSPKAGLLFEPDEINEPIATACELMSLRTVTLLSQLLVDFDLSRTDAGKSGEPYRVEAVFKRPTVGLPPKVREVRLELDPRTKEIRKAVLKRNVPAPLGGFHALTLTFDLIETADLPANVYTLGGHLDIGANIFDRRDPHRKMRTAFREELIRKFGERILRP
jgi:hypothetical protein